MRVRVVAFQLIKLKLKFTAFVLMMATATVLMIPSASFAQSDDCSGWCKIPGLSGQQCWDYVHQQAHVAGNKCSNYAYHSPTGTVARSTWAECYIDWGGDLYGNIDCNFTDSCNVSWNMNCGGVQHFGVRNCYNAPGTGRPLVSVEQGFAHCTSNMDGYSWSCFCNGTQLTCGTPL